MCLIKSKNSYFGIGYVCPMLFYVVLVVVIRLIVCYN